jgi:hypothetical protein
LGVLSVSGAGVPGCGGTKIGGRGRTGGPMRGTGLAGASGRAVPG